MAEQCLMFTSGQRLNLKSEKKKDRSKFLIDRYWANFQSMPTKAR